MALKESKVALYPRRKREPVFWGVGQSGPRFLGVGWRTGVSRRPEIDASGNKAL